MNRSEFFRVCALGACSSCALPAQSGDSEAEQARRRLGAAQARFGQLITLLQGNVDEATRKKLYAALGSWCGRIPAAEAAKLKPDVRAFVAKMQKDWGLAQADYDEARGTVRIVDTRGCGCPAAKAGVTPGEFCECSLAWQKEVFTAVTGKPVRVELEESMLRGGKRCAFVIHVG